MSGLWLRSPLSLEFILSLPKGRAPSRRGSTGSPRTDARFRPWMPVYTGKTYGAGSRSLPSFPTRSGIHPLSAGFGYPFALSIVEGRIPTPTWFDKPVLSVAEGLTTSVPRSRPAAPVLPLGGLCGARVGTLAGVPASRTPCLLAVPLRCVSVSWGSPAAIPPSGRGRR